MTFEILIVISAAIIFVILARRLPDIVSGNIQSLPEEKKRIYLPALKFNFQKIIAKIKIPSLPKMPKISLPIARKHLEPVKKDDLQNMTSFELMELADGALDRGDLDQAEKYCIQAVTKTPDNPKIYNRLGIIYLQLKNYADARDAFLTSLRFDDRIASRHYNLFLAYMGLGRGEKAKVSLRKAIDLDPKKEKYLIALKGFKNI